MTPNDLKRFKAWFAGYVAPYYREDDTYNRPLRLKEDHTRRVCREIRRLGRALQLTPREMILAETMALFHDLGRFQQYVVYGTFNDRASRNHAHLSLQQLARHGVLAGCPAAERRLITKAIAHHNAARLPDGEDPQTLFFIRLLRDADKLDIWKVFLEYYSNREKPPDATIVQGLPDLPSVSGPIIAALCENRFARLGDLNTLNDFKLLQISWVFDLNFRVSLEAVRQRRYIDHIRATLPSGADIDRAVHHAAAYVERVLSFPAAAANLRRPIDWRPSA